MVDVFVSYKREDAERAKRVVDALRAENLEVWWDHGIGSGMEWRAEIRRQIDQARVVCVLWSRHSVVSDWVAEEAEWGRERGALCPALIDQVRPPLGLGSVQAANLVGWKGARRDPAWQYFIECIRARLEGKALPERKPPKPRAPVLPIVGGVLAAAAAVLSIGATLEQMGVIDLLKNWPAVAANARQATAAEAAEWTSIQQSHDCAAIAQYLRSNPGGVFAGEAQALLAAKQTIAEAGWEPYQQAG